MAVGNNGREELEREARRVGVPQPESLGREELVRAIRRRGGSRALDRARKLFGAAVGLARTAFDMARGPPRLPSRGAPAGLREEPEAAATGAPDTATPAPKASGPREAAGEEAATDEATPPRAPARSRAEPPPPAEEPIPTRTMARILAEQGHPRRALAIYDRLLHQHPNDVELQQEAAAVRARTGRAPRRGGASAEDTSAETDDDDHELVVATVEDASVVVAWSVSDAALRRARAVLGVQGILTTRAVITSPDPVSTVDTSTREQHEVPMQGEWVLSGLPDHARVVASVGLASEHRYVSVAHAPVHRMGHVGSYGAAVAEPG